MKTYLVTGGCGFIGSHLVNGLVNAGSRVVVLDNQPAGIDRLASRLNANVRPRVSFVEGDVRELSAVEDALRDVDGCFHLASRSPTAQETGPYELTRMHGVNVGGTLNVLASAAQAGIPVVYASSASVYGDSADTPLSERSFARPIDTYGADKLSCELHARAAGTTWGLRSVGLRFFDVYGPGQNPSSRYSRIISRMLTQLLDGDTIQTGVDSGQVRDFVFVDDAVEHLLAAMACASPCAPVYNVCTGHPVSIRDLARALLNLSGRDSAIDTTFNLGPRICAAVGDPRLAMRALGVRTRHRLAAGLLKLLQSVGPTTASMAAES